VLDMIMNKTYSPSSSKDFTLYKGELLSSCCCANVTWKAIYQPSAARQGGVPTYTSKVDLIRSVVSCEGVVGAGTGAAVTHARFFLKV
jgi:hypothetical protein